MSYEVELKAHVKEKERLLNKLSEMGCCWDDEKTQYDRIFYKPDDTALNLKGDVFLRIREESGQEKFLTLKRIQSKTNVIEFESMIGNSDEVARMLREIGFSKYVEIEKNRMEGKIADIVICIDEVKGLGCFIEVEKIVHNDSEIESAEQKVREFLLSLGVNLDQICDKRYHTMLHEKKKI